uniref:Uncharacterized protein n=1 Tax=Amphimedon queenslandica TaxID=400682 RepID=A0A1X7SNQ7_AMPQE
MTAEYNGTRVVCFASGPGAFSSSQPVIILVQTVPPKPFNDDVRVCKLGCQVFFSWTPVNSVLGGIDVSYNITDNHRQNMTINKPHYSLKLNDELAEYEGTIVMVLRASAFNQVAYSEPKTIRYQLSDTNLTLVISSISLENKDIIKYNFIIRLNDLNQCSFNNLTDEKFIACDHRDKLMCKNNSVNLDYQETGGELVFSSTLNSLRRKFNSTLSFDYLGVEIETDKISL